MGIRILIDGATFKREKKKIYLAEFVAEIDLITQKNGSLFVAEIKKSSRTMASGIKQLKYYLYLLSIKGIKCKGIIKIPKEKIDEIETLLSKENIPVPPKIPFCRKCLYFEFCWN